MVKHLFGVYELVTSEEEKNKKINMASVKLVGTFTQGTSHDFESREAAIKFANTFIEENYFKIIDFENIHVAILVHRDENGEIVTESNLINRKSNVWLSSKDLSALDFFGSNLIDIMSVEI